MGLLDFFIGPPSKDKFAQMMMDAIRKAGETTELHYDPKEYWLQVEGGDNTLNLMNAYNEYCAAPKANKPTLIRNFVQTWFSTKKEMPDDFESAQHDILPGIRNRMMYEHAIMTLTMDGSKPVRWPYRPLGEFLGVGLVYDLPSSMMQLQQHALDDWKTTFEDAYEVACENLRAITKHTMNEVAPGVWMSPWRDNYDPSRMLLIDYVRHHDVKGDPVAIVPNRDTLFLTGSEDATGLASLATMAEKEYEHPRSLSGIAFRLTEENEWVPFLPEPAHSHYKNYRILKIQSIGTDYQDQQEALNKLHEKTGKDIFVASYSALENKDTGNTRSYCVWSEGVVAFLPKTDDIFFFRPKEDEEGEVIATAPWEQAATVLGDRLKPVGIYPERYLVEEFPSEEELAAFGQM